MEIKKPGFLLGILLLALTPLNAAWSQFGIKGGLAVSGFQLSQNASSLTGNDYRPFLGYEIEWLQEGDASSPDLGLQFGIFYARSIFKYFAVQPELYYSQRGLHFYQTELYNSAYSLDVDYLEVPLLLKFKIPLKWRVKPGLLAGPYAAFKLSANRTLRIWEEQHTKRVSSVKDLDYGLVFAINSEFSAWSRELLFEIRFNWGLASMMAQPAEFTELYEDAGRVNVLAISFLTGIAF
jgi:hypothetical protein